MAEQDVRADVIADRSRMASNRSSSWRVAVLLTLAALAAAPCSLASERLPPDVFAGYSFAQIEDIDRHGVNLAASFALAGAFSGFVDSSAHWGAESLWRHQRDVTVMAGPGVRLGKPGGPAFFLRALIGLATDRTSYPEFAGSVPYSHSGLGLMAGGGVDLPIGSRVALRVQADCLWTERPEGSAPTAGSPAGVPRIIGTPGPAPSSLSAAFRASGGIVYRFGAP